ncbi:PIR protein [Plasmodium ovale]|uniref:PIR Superfamily Protein n=2 Tax=Plasmodium ovale TaxID=36330 RepID=A0A1A8WD22_PLAOA|nr:PIR Superfamily Protein [Plasmodium ovale curtisi]SBT01223.1 PIR Superfamily Protein [Plasmodium ovale curtisi]SBT84971.1 PIR protein [Plasmodium ovale]
MSPNTDDPTFWKSIKEHTTTQNDILGNTYKKFEDMCSKDDNRNYCLIDKDQYKSCNNVKKLYYNLNGNKAKYEWANEEFSALYQYPIKFCNYLKYWAYDKIIFNNFDKDEVKEVLDTLKNGDKFQIIMGNSYTCIFDIFELEKIKNIKLFYDYIGSYDADKKESSIGNKICGSSYKENLNRMIRLYNDRNVKGEKESYEYSNEFLECEKTYNIDSLCKLQCVDDVSLSLNEEKEGCSEVYSSSQHSSTYDNPVEKLSPDPYHVREKNTSLGITMSVIPTLVISFVIFPILYKLTPFGPWLHKFVMKSKNSLFNPNENSTDTLLNHISETGSENFMERPHYIAYHSY